MHAILQVRYVIYIWKSPGAAPEAECRDGGIRLSEGLTNMEGRVEICNGGVWGSVCKHNFGELEATVVCKQLGFAECEQWNLLLFKLYWAYACIDILQLGC